MAEILLFKEDNFFKTFLARIGKSVDKFTLSIIINLDSIKNWFIKLISKLPKSIEILCPSIHFAKDKTKENIHCLKLHGRCLRENRKMVGKAHIPLVLPIFLVMLSFAHLSRADTLVPLSPLPLTITENSEKMALGERLFHDRRLSGQGTRSCATCHPLDQGAMDGHIRAESEDGITLLRNTPTLFNVAYNYFYNWDGVVTTLEAHMERVLVNPKIMDANWPALLDRLRTDKNYIQVFNHAYPNGLTQANVVDALTRFERGLVTPNARFDRFLRGDKDALDAAEQQGYHLFNSLGCVACHQGMNIGGNLFQKFGVFEKPKGSSKGSDDGRYNVTKNERDKDVFRVPSLRNVALTAPYFHDGSAATLDGAVDIMAKDQLGKPLTEQERGLIIKFLKTLTGEYRGRPVVRASTGKQ